MPAYLGVSRPLTMLRMPPFQGGQLAQLVVPSNPWITAPGTNSLRSDFTGWVGGSFLVGAAALHVKSLGRIFLTGNTQLHDVGIFDLSGNPLLIVSVDCTAGINREFNYTDGTLTLSAATEYIIASLETNGGDQWIDDAAQTVTADASIVSRAFRPGTGTSGGFSGNPGVTMFVPPNFKYTL